MRDGSGPVARFMAAVLGVFCGAVAAVCGLLFLAAPEFPPVTSLLGVAAAIGAYCFLHVALTGRDPHSTVLWPPQDG
jgi:hypothetical protein